MTLAAGEHRGDRRRGAGRARRVTHGATLLAADVFVIDVDDHGLEVAKRFGATAVINSSASNVRELIMRLAGGRGVDTAIEAVGIPATFELCESIVAPGGVVANIGVHGVEVALHLEQLWDRNITITTRLVDAASTQMLLDVVRARKLDPKRLITHRFKLDQIDAAYHTFGHAADERALKVLIEASA
jgi:alcohol dehydrogenase